jgi:zinc transporter 1/2/3
MLPAGMKTLTDPCLPDSWNVYGAYAGPFAMVAALIMQLIEFIAHQRYQSIKTSVISNGKSEESKNKEQAEIHISVVDAVTTPAKVCDSTEHYHGIAFQDNIQNHKISTYLLEFGIALHSVLIGLALGTTTESFIALFIALSFHQFFEAVALGAQIARLEHISLRSAIFMVIFFALTTPVGIAIGISIHSKTYNPKSTTSLLVNGILDSISGGILIYVALINLITAEMGVGAHAFHSLSKRLKLLYFVALYAGVGAMAVIGRWA